MKNGEIDNGAAIGGAEAVAGLIERFCINQRQACSVAGLSRGVVSYCSTMRYDEPLQVRFREFAVDRHRFSYRSLDYLLMREGIKPNHWKLRRIYCEEGLKVCRRGGRKRA